MWIDEVDDVMDLHNACGTSVEDMETAAAAQIAVRSGCGASASALFRITSPMAAPTTPRPVRRAKGSLTTASCAHRDVEPDVLTPVDYDLAQLNIGIGQGPIDSPVMAEFVANLDRINAVAEASPGFVWRLKADDGNATSLRPFGDPDILVNMSVWRDVESLRLYVYTSEHVRFLRRRKEWFRPMAAPPTVLWWVPRGQIPSLDEAKSKLEQLRANGPTAQAFTFRALFPPPLSAVVNPLTRLGALAWFSAVQFFIAQVVVALAWFRPYSLKHDYISNLGDTSCGPDAVAAVAGVCSPRHALMNASFIAIGITMALGGLLAREAFVPGWRRALAVGFFCLAGAGVVLVGANPENQWTEAHAFGAGLNFLFGNVALVLFGLALPASRRALSRLSVVSGVVGLAGTVLFVAGIYLGLGVGGMERVAAYPMSTWQVMAGIALWRWPSR